jgi:hypothetical protein
MAGAPVSVIGDGGLSGAELSLFNSGTNGRVPNEVAQRNSFKGPGVHNVDARVSRTFPIHERFRLELFAEAFNITNHRNILSVSTNLLNYQSATSTSTTCPSSLVSGCLVPLATTVTQFGATTGTSAVIYGPRQLQIAAKLNF